MTEGLGDPRRLAALAESGLVDSPPEAAFDRVTRLVTEVLHVPVALFTLVTADRQVFKSSFGVGDLRETPLSHSFCRHVVDDGTPLEVVDARIHPKVRDNPSVSELGIVAYLGVPLTTAARCAPSITSRASGPAATTACSRTWPARPWPRSSCAGRTGRSLRRRPSCTSPPRTTR
jgi:GAF domain-containing protein